MFWSNKVNDKLIDNRNNLFSKIRNIDWHMEIICAEEGFEIIKNCFKNNNHINVTKVKNKSCNFKLENLHRFALIFYWCSSIFYRCSSIF